MYTFSGLFRRKPHSRFEIRGNYWVRNGSLKNEKELGRKSGKKEVYFVHTEYEKQKNIS